MWFCPSNDVKMAEELSMKAKTVKQNCCKQENNEEGLKSKNPSFY